MRRKLWPDDGRLGFSLWEDKETRAFIYLD